MALQSLQEHINSLNDDYNNLSEAYFETHSQYQNEVSQFGDAWAGSANQLQEMRDDMLAVSTKIDTAMRIQANLQD